MSQSIYEEVASNYYPFTKDCPMDGQHCIEKKCKFWMGGKLCWDREFKKIVIELYGDCNYTFFKIKQGYGQIAAHIFLWLHDREDFSYPPKTTVEITFNSLRLAQKIKEKFKLDTWDIEPRCYDGGDDHSLIFNSHASYLEEQEIRENLTQIKDMILKMAEAEDEINTCELCKVHSETLTDYNNKSLCSHCVNKIINENLFRYLDLQ